MIYSGERYEGLLLANNLSVCTMCCGTYVVNWDGTNNGGQHVASGVYFSRMQAGAYSTTKKMSLVK